MPVYNGPCDRGQNFCYPQGPIYEEVIVSYTPTVRNVAVRNASNIKQCRSSKNYNDNNNNNNNDVRVRGANIRFNRLEICW